MDKIIADEELFIQECLTIKVSPIMRSQIFDGYTVISDTEKNNIMGAMYSKEELDKIKHDAMEFYGEDDKLNNAINDEFHRIVEEGGRYEFN